MVIVMMLFHNSMICLAIYMMFLFDPVLIVALYEVEASLSFQYWGTYYHVTSEALDTMWIEAPVSVCTKENILPIRSYMIYLLLGGLFYKASFCFLSIKAIELIWLLHVDVLFWVVCLAHVGICFYILNYDN